MQKIHPLTRLRVLATKWVLRHHVPGAQLLGYGNRKWLKGLGLDEARVGREIADQAFELAAVSQLEGKSAYAMFAELASFLMAAGRQEMAEQWYRMALEGEPSAQLHSFYLQCLMMSPSATPEQQLIAAKDWGRRYAPPPQSWQPHENRREEGKRLKVGYVCHFFHNSVSRSLLLPSLVAHDREAVEIYCYNDAPAKEVPADVRAAADVWRDVAGMDTEGFCRQVRADGIDVLIELNGHCVVNRFPAFAHRPAPVQISFYNFPATCGVPGVDYIMIGETRLDAQAQAYFTEKVHHLPGTWGIAIFPDHFPPVAPVPSAAKGYITFGSFGATHKIPRAEVALWAEILKRVPGSRFFMKAGALDHPRIRRLYEGYFLENGIPLERVRMEGMDPHDTMLRKYAEVDIALDSFPYNAGTTTMEALWQGVPVVTQQGPRLMSMAGRMIIGSTGHLELVGNSPQEFIEKAVVLAHDPARLTRYRETLREDFRRSPRGDARLFSQQLEEAFREMWWEYCRKDRDAVAA